MQVRNKEWDIIVKKDHCPFLYSQYEYRNCGNWESDTGVCEKDNCPIINENEGFKEISITNTIDNNLDDYLLSETGKQIALNIIKESNK